MRVYNVDELDQTPSLIDAMSFEEIQHFLQENYRRRLPKHIRPHIKNRLAEIKNQQRIIQKAERIEDRISAIWDRVENLWTKKRTERLIRYHARSMGTDIHDFPSVWSGLESQQSIKQRAEAEYNGTKYRGCREHYYPRQWAGQQIINRLYEGGKDFTKYDLAANIYEYSHVHIVTPRENQLLLPFQTTDEFTTPDEAYKKAKIKLVRVAPHQVNHGWIMLLETLYQRCVVDGRRQ